MKRFMLILGLFCIISAMQAQDRYISRNGHISFFSKTALETIEAHNNQVASVIDIKKGSIAFTVLSKSFKFERALMEEHFNENYMESSKFPKSVFSGTFAGFDVNNFAKAGKYDVVVEGDMTIHGVKKHLKQPGTVEVKDGKIIAKSKFKVKPEDYGIQIPGLVRDKISSNMEIAVDINYDPFNK
jgi:polyisoprenoid-binding protein YceI